MDVNRLKAKSLDPRFRGDEEPGNLRDMTLVSGVLSPHGPPGQLLDMVLAGSLGLVADARILAEYEEVLCRPHLGFSSSVVRVLLESLDGCAERFVVPPWPQHPLPDPSDEPFLAVAAQASVPLVPGNRHYPPGSRGGVLVLTPREYYERLCGVS